MENLRLIIIGGLPLSGKSTLGDALSVRTGLHFADIDRVRSEAFGLPTREEYERQWADREQGAKWSSSRMGMAYELLHEGVVDIALQNGQSLIISATYSRVNSQGFAKKVAEEHGALVRFIFCQLVGGTREEIERRMARDADEKYIHGCATWNDYLDITARFEALDTTGVFPKESVLVVDTSRPLTDDMLDSVATFAMS